MFLSSQVIYTKENCIIIALSSCENNNLKKYIKYFISSFNCICCSLLYFILKTIHHSICGTVEIGILVLKGTELQHTIILYYTLQVTSVISIEIYIIKIIVYIVT